MDVPGHLPGVQQNTWDYSPWCQLLYAYSEATVPKSQSSPVKHGGSYLAMCRFLRADTTFAWPTAEIAVMGPEGAVNVINCKEIAAAENPIESTAWYRTTVIALPTHTSLALEVLLKML